MLADVLNRDKRTSADFNFNFRDYAVCDEIHVDLDSARTWFAALNLGSEREFGLRERLIVQLLRPHLTGLYRSASSEGGLPPRRRRSTLKPPID